MKGKKGRYFTPAIRDKKIYYTKGTKLKLSAAAPRRATHILKGHKSYKKVHKQEHSPKGKTHNAHCRKIKSYVFKCFHISTSLSYF